MRLSHFELCSLNRGYELFYQVSVCGMRANAIFSQKGDELHGLKLTKFC